MVASESLGFNSAAFNSCSIPVYSLFNVTRIIPMYYFFLIQEMPHLACNKKENMHTYVHIRTCILGYMCLYVSICLTLPQKKQNSKDGCEALLSVLWEQAGRRLHNLIAWHVWSLLRCRLCPLCNRVCTGS